MRKTSKFCPHFFENKSAVPQKILFSRPAKNHFYISHFPAGLLPKLGNEKEKNKKRPPKAKEKIIKKTRIEVAQQKNAAKLQKKECRPGRRSRPQSAIGEEGKNDRRWIEPPGQ